MEAFEVYVEEMSPFLVTSELTESTPYIHSFVKVTTVGQSAATIHFGVFTLFRDDVDAGERDHVEGDGVEFVVAGGEASEAPELVAEAFDYVSVADKPRLPLDPRSPAKTRASTPRSAQHLRRMQTVSQGP